MNARRMKRKGTYDINQNVHIPPLPSLNQLCGVVISPFCFVVGAKVAGEGFLTPGAGGRIGDWSEGGDGSVLGGVFEELFLGRRQGICSSYQSSCSPKSFERFLSPFFHYTPKPSSGSSSYLYNRSKRVKD